MDTSTPPDAKLRVDSVTDGLVSKERCLITNIECNKATDYAHVLGRALEKNDDVMTSLEYSWKKKWRTQNIHTRYNIFRLSAKFHRLFDTKKWLLLPETRILDRYEKVLEKPYMFPKIEEGTYKYKLVAHPDMGNVPIHRRDETLPISPHAFEKFVYPFEEFPTIVSHVHPRFVICDAALKFGDTTELYAFAGAEHGNLFNALLKVAHIYEGWSTVLLPNNFRQEINVAKVQPRLTLDRQGKGNVSYAEPPDFPPPPATTIAATLSVRSVRSVPACSIADGTPDDRARDADLEKAKANVDNLAPKRCLIENTDETNVLDYAHILRRRTPNETLTALEYSWGMDHMTLNVDSRYNIFRLSRTFHRLFDQNAWLLIPEQAIIDEYYAVREQRGKFPSLENHQPPYSYTLVVNNLMEQVPIHVQRGTEDELDNDNAFICHMHPFHGFPLIRSHVHPRFVICNTGGKLKNSVYLGAQYNILNPLRRNALDQIREIYELWTQPGVPREFTDTGALHQEKPSDDCPDDKTEPRRLLRSGKRISPPLAADGNPLPQKRAKSGGGNDSAWLDDATLGELEPDQSPKKAWQDKVAWIQSWVGQVPMDATVEEIPMDIAVVDKLAGQTPDERASDSEDMESLLSA